MSKKVVIISSSPRKGGNSDLLCDEFARGVKDSGNEVEKLYVNDMDIHYCTGCCYCVENHGNCSRKDDMEMAREKMLAADIIVLATPVYFYTMAGQLKTFIDRVCHFHQILNNKEFYYIMTSADGSKSAMNLLMTEFNGFLRCLSNPTLKGYISGTGVYNKGDVKNKIVMQEAYQMGMKA